MCVPIGTIVTARSTTTSFPRCTRSACGLLSLFVPNFVRLPWAHLRRSHALMIPCLDLWCRRCVDRTRTPRSTGSVRAGLSVPLVPALRTLCAIAGRMLAGGDQPLYIARRLVRFASEDIGMVSSPLDCSFLCLPLRFCSACCCVCVCGAAGGSAGSGASHGCAAGESHGHPSSVLATFKRFLCLCLSAQAVHFIGMPEGDLALAQVCVCR